MTTAFQIISVDEYLLRGDLPEEIWTKAVTVDIKEVQVGWAEMLEDMPDDYNGGGENGEEENGGAESKKNKA